ncbi:MAG: DUF2783 domain-containing protein [Comamonadaceae bacterium]|nr:MAG: DUF2783 domain-containing protein [Comamonadaceae bacterium]
MKSPLTQPDADRFYEMLLDAHGGLSGEQSEMLNARLILLLGNEIADTAVLEECVKAARHFIDG